MAFLAQFRNDPVRYALLFTIRLFTIRAVVAVARPISFGLGPVELPPDLSSNQNQVEFLLGITFGSGSR
jgi:hypothetical protein